MTSNCLELAIKGDKLGFLPDPSLKDWMERRQQRHTCRLGRGTLATWLYAMNDILIFCMGFARSTTISCGLAFDKYKYIVFDIYCQYVITHKKRPEIYAKQPKSKFQGHSALPTDFFRINALLKVKWSDFTNEKRVKRLSFTGYKIPIRKVISKEFEQYFLFSFA